MADGVEQQLKRIADALERAYPPVEVSFADVPWASTRLARRLVERVEGDDYLLHDDEREGGDVE